MERGVSFFHSTCVICFSCCQAKAPKDTLSKHYTAALQPLQMAGFLHSILTGRVVRILAKPGVRHLRPVVTLLIITSLSNPNTLRSKRRDICEVPVMSKVCSQGHVYRLRVLQVLLPFTSGPWESHFRLGCHIYCQTHQETLFIVLCSLRQYGATVLQCTSRTLRHYNQALRNTDHQSSTIGSAASVLVCPWANH